MIVLGLTGVAERRGVGAVLYIGLGWLAVLAFPAWRSMQIVDALAAGAELDCLFAVER